MLDDARCRDGKGSCRSVPVHDGAVHDGGRDRVDAGPLGGANHWINSNPPNLQGRVDPGTLRLLVARFTIGGTAPETLSFAANVLFNEGPGTPLRSASKDGSGPVIEVPYACASPGCSAGCSADLDRSGSVDGSDLGIMISEWGACAGCDSDLDGDGLVDGADLATLLDEWDCR